MNMRKTMKKLILLCLVAVTLCGCNSYKFSMTSSNSKTTVKVNHVEDGDTADSSAFEVGKNRVVNIESSLTQGELQIAFVSAINVASIDDDDNWIKLDTVKTVTVGPEDQLSFPLDRGDYIMEFTAVGETDGSVVITITKSE